MNRRRLPIGMQSFRNLRNKECADYIRFVFVTGISMYSKVSLFSGLNNLNDISLFPRHATICGYTDFEGFERKLKAFFAGIPYQITPPLKGSWRGKASEKPALRLGDAEAVRPGASRPPTESVFACGSTSSTPPQGGSDSVCGPASSTLLQGGVMESCV